MSSVGCKLWVVGRPLGDALGTAVEELGKPVTLDGVELGASVVSLGDELGTLVSFKLGSALGFGDTGDKVGLSEVGSATGEATGDSVVGEACGVETGDA